MWNVCSGEIPSSLTSLLMPSNPPVFCVGDPLGHLNRLDWSPDHPGWGAILQTNRKIIIFQATGHELAGYNVGGAPHLDSSEYFQA